jgi:class 3 adenylate cyclase
MTTARAPGELPSGTVTLLFTDIEGSTRLLSELGESYAASLASHRRLLRAAFERHGGVEVDTAGDGFFVAFARASDAVAAAAEGQAALGDGPILVRMGMHTGEPLVTDEGYVGIDVHRAARIAASAQGGQTLLSQATRDLVDQDTTDLGAHRLRDLDQPMRLYQLGTRSFAPLRTGVYSGLVVPATRLVGRAREVGELVRLVRTDRVRLLTITGPGGVGKTRLAVEVAAELASDFRHGCRFADLTGIADPALVLPAIAARIGAGSSAASYLGEREVLLAIDGFEHVIDAAPEVAQLVEEAPGIVVVATSREPLRVRGERQYAIHPLAATGAKGAPGSSARSRDSARRTFTSAPLCSPRWGRWPGNAVISKPRAVSMKPRCSSRGKPTTPGWRGMP